MVTAYTDGVVTLRSNRRLDGYHEAADMSGMQGVRVGDFVVHGLDILRGSVGVSDADGAMSSVCVICAPIADAEPRYFAWQIRAQAASGLPRALARGVREGGADFRRWDTLAELPVLCPPPDAQRAIADYLDTETARIDALIAKKQRMIELLDERFRAKGRHLVTGGSPAGGWSPGAAWAGPVPLDWSPYKIASFARLGSGTTPASDVADYYGDEGTAWVTTAELREREITTTARCVTDLALRDCSALKVFPAGAVLVAMYGATVGRVGILGMPAATNQACCAIHGASPHLDLKFVYWWLVLNRQHLLDMAYGAGQPNISQETIRSLRVPAPGVGEQQSIAAKLDHLHSRTAEYRAVLERQINLLAEHRQALITAAVTGELEVPGVAA